MQYKANRFSISAGYSKELHTPNYANRSFSNLVLNQFKNVPKHFFDLANLCANLCIILLNLKFLQSVF